MDGLDARGDEWRNEGNGVATGGGVGWRREGVLAGGGVGRWVAFRRSRSPLWRELRMWGPLETRSD